MAGPDGVFLQIPTQLLRFDWADWGDELPTLFTVDIRLARKRRLINQSRAGGRATHTLVLIEFQISEFEDQFLQRLGLRLNGWGNISRKSFSQGHEQMIHRCFDSAGLAAHTEINRLLAEKVFQHTELRAVQ
jgi:hypothetical protein